MPPDAVRRVRRLDECSMREAPDDRVGFARLGELKGLENEAIVVVDLPAPDGTGRTSAEHYSDEPGALGALMPYRSVRGRC